MSKTLTMEFLTDKLTSHTITINNISDSLTGTEVKAAMQSIITSDVVTNSRAENLVSPKSAYITAKNVTSLVLPA